MKLKKLISSLSAMALLTVSLAGYANQTGFVYAENSSPIEISDDIYSANVTYDVYYKITMYGKETMSQGTLSDFQIKKPCNEVSIPSVIDNSNDWTDIAVMSVTNCDCSSIKSLILPDTMSVFDISQLKNAQDLEFLTIPSTITSVKGYDSKQEYNFKIRGNIGSYAEKFAKENGLSFIASGDINSDNSYDGTDIGQMKEYMYGKSELTPSSEKSADLNYDQKLDIADYIMLKNTVADPPLSACGASTADALAAPDMGNVKTGSCTEEQISGYQNFVADSSDEILLDSDSHNANPVYSPFSIYSALAMTAECTSGNTQKEILDVLNADSIDNLRSDHDEIFSSLYFDNFSTYCRINNSLWLNSMYKFKQDTLDNIADFYYAPSFGKNFSLQSVPSEISDWIYRNTSGKFKPAVEIESDDIIKIINTVSFKERWFTPFGTAKTDTFNLSDGSEKECSFLNSFYEQEKIGYGENFMKYGISMGNGYRMNFILPDENVSVSQIISDSDTMKNIISDNIEYCMRKIYFKVPKFNVTSSYQIIPAAQKLGINDAFHDGADFTGLLDYNENNIPGVYIDQIKHEATLSIDEQGCEAAAYTIVSPVPCCCPPEYQTVYFYLDKPFYYYVTNSKNIPVFSGIVNDPTQN